MPERSSWSDVESLLPHTGVARFLTRIHDVTATTIDATGRVPREHALVSGTRAPSFLAIELGAQAAAAMEAVARRASGSSGAAVRGSLVRIRDARLLQPTFSADAMVHVVVDLVASAPPLAMYTLRAHVGDTAVVEATFSTHAGDAGVSA